MYKTIYRKTISNTNPTKQPGMNSGAPEGYEVPAPHVLPLVLLLLLTLISHEWGMDCDYNKQNTSMDICDKYSVIVN
jgi:hypothetical protein